MQLDDVLPGLMGSLVLSELLFRGEGPPWACSRMDQYQRKMRKPVGSEGHRAQQAGGSTPSTSPSHSHLDSDAPVLPLTQATGTDVTPGSPTTCHALCNSLGATSLCSLNVPMRSGPFNTILCYK